LKEQLSFLIELQEHDSAMGRIHIKKKELPEKIIKMDEEFAAFVSNVDEEKKKLDELNKRHKDKEEKLKRGIETLKKTKDRLLEVKTNKEYQAILKEIETIEKKNSEIEDEVITAMEELDHVRISLKTSEKELDAFRQQYERNKQKIEEELSLLDGELQACQERIRNVTGRINERLLKRYGIIKGAKNGLAVTFVWKEVCGGCHMNIPPQLYIELQKYEELMFCPSCNRIIYWRDQDKSSG
jgi:uncharacterized protein